MDLISHHTKKVNNQKKKKERKAHNTQHRVICAQKSRQTNCRRIHKKKKQLFPFLSLNTPTLPTHKITREKEEREILKS